ncbi:MAG: prephenate dehydratase, partial [Nonlabens sp.]|nr:prephenate dehydratase [Nonlabens sp.]
LFAANEMNLTKILSIPIVAEPFMFSFVVDVSYGNEDTFNKVADQLIPLTGSLSILGMYKSHTI